MNVPCIPVITGIGLLTPLGASAAATWEALLAGRYVAGHSKVPVETPAHRARASHLALLAAREAIARLDPDWTRHAALVVGTSKGPIEDWLRIPASISGEANTGVVGLSQIAADLASELEIRGPRLTLSAACASGLHALIRGAMLIQSGQAARVLVVASEAAVHPLIIASFRKLGVLPAEGVGCRPFDRQRDGFLLSEAAAAVSLEASGPGIRGIAVERFAMACDAAHLTGASPDMAALRRALNSVIGGRAVDLLHAHGTGTTLNDPAELQALDDLARGQATPPCVYSHKGALGHSQGAAGLVSVVINVMCHRHGMVPGNVRTTDLLTARNVSLSSSPAERPIRRSIALAAGFGGPIGAVALACTE